jgi:peptide/nickel transport system substrate-binding protein
MSGVPARFALLGGLAVFVVGACGLTGPGARAGCDATPVASPAAGPRSAARLTIAIPDDPGSPLNIWTSNQSFDALVDLVYDKLVAPSPYVDAPAPGLAESVTQVDPADWTVRLRAGVTWQDGVPFTAEDVRFTIEYFRTGVPNRYTHHTNDVPDLGPVTVVDPLTVRIHCARPCPELGTVTLADLPILPEHVWRGIAEPARNTALPIGTGPYRLVAYVPGQYLRFQANRAYYLGPPTVDELVMPIVRDQDATFTALRTGEIDVADRTVPPELLDTVRQMPGVRVVTTTPLTALLLRLNFLRPPFDVPGVRHAISLAIDRDALVRTLLLGHGRPGTAGYPHPDSPWTSPGLSTPFDAAAARLQLDDLGYRDSNGDGVRDGAGRPLAFTVKVAGTEPARVRAAQLLVDQLAAVGIRLTVVVTDAATIRSLYASHDFDLLIDQGSAHELADPDQFVESSRSGLAWSRAVPYPEWDALIATWTATTTLEARRRAGFAAQILFNRAPTVIALWYPDEQWAFRAGAYDGWAESRGYGIVNKWSLLPAAARAPMVVRPFV